MAEHDCEVRVANHTGSCHVIVLLDCENLGANDASIFGNSDQADSHNRLLDTLAKRSHDSDGEKNRRDSEHHVHDAHDDGIPLAALVARDRAKQNANGKRYSHSGKAHDEGNLGADEHAAEDVAALKVGAEPVLGRRALRGMREVLLVGIVGQHAGNELRHNGYDHENEDEDGRHERRLVGDDAVDDVLPDALALFNHRRCCGVRIEFAGAFGRENRFLAHLDHPSSFAPYLMRGSSHA